MMHVRIAAAVLALVALDSCSDHSDAPHGRPAVNYAPREPGSTAVPTHELSMQLMGNDGPMRHENFQRLLIQSGRACSFVNSAVFRAGLDGSDEWMVTCADSGRWDIWFRPGLATQIFSCTAASCD